MPEPSGRCPPYSHARDRVPLVAEAVKASSRRCGCEGHCAAVSCDQEGTRIAEVVEEAVEEEGGARSRIHELSLPVCTATAGSLEASPPPKRAAEDDRGTSEA